jgi:two-component system LytT family sensor kinase
MESRATSLEANAFPIGKSMLVSFGVAIILALAVAASVYLSMIDHGHSFARMFGWQLGSWGFWALVAPLVLHLGGRRLFGGASVAYSLTIAVVLGLLLIAVHDVVTAAFTVWMQPFYPLHPGTLTGNLIAQLPSLFVIDVFVYTLLLVGGGAYYQHRRARELDLRESRLEAELARAQLHALRLEIQPHFLFNTLNSISALIRLKDHDGALKMLLGLSDLMRTAVEQPKDQLVTLSAEIEFVKRYVDLQRARFADRLQVDYQIGDECRDVTVPTLSNTRSRLAQLYGAAASFEVRAGDAAGTIVEMAFPFSPPVRIAAATP